MNLKLIALLVIVGLLIAGGIALGNAIENYGASHDLSRGVIGSGYNVD